VQTGLLNQRGVLALARLAPGTAASEFFINISDSPMLDSGNTDDGRDGFGYTTFGRVLRGMRVVEKIQSLPTEQSSVNAVVNGQLLSNKVVIRRAYRAL
jgi:peptidyl-prolyl cis-trans isomerase A (cyclophilin A)